MKESDGIRTVSLDMEFKGSLASLRQLSKLSQKDMAAALHISPQYYYDLENGRRLPSVNIIHKIVAFLKLGHRKAAVRAWHIMAARTHGWDV